MSNPIADGTADPDPAATDVKRGLREEAFAKRDALERDWRARAAERIAEQVLDLPELLHLQPIGAYWPIRSEVDPRQILEGLCARGQTVALSQILHPHLSWREWRPGDVLVHGAFGVREPGPDAPEVFPRALLVPMAAFDRDGGRLGYGKGHFDRAVADLSRLGHVLTVGLAYSTQEIEAVPKEAHDLALDLIVTETGILRPGAG
jgi:5-formyltetrahydrofolate cyclo-ligase